MDFRDYEYIHRVSPRLERFTKVGDNLWSFRCPYCGDSKRNKYKKRGYFFSHGKTAFFKCHNCGHSCSLPSFLKDHASDLFSEYTLSDFQDKKNDLKEKEDSKFTVSSYKMRKRFESSSIIEKFPKLSEVDSDNPGRLYVEGRMIPSGMMERLIWVENPNDILKMIPRYSERLLQNPKSAVGIPFYGRDGRLTYIQFRFIDHESKIRYMTCEVSKGHKIWGLDHLDPSKDVFVFEGVFDACFLDNSVAVAGADFIQTVEYLKSFVTGKIFLVWDTDYRSNPEVYQRVMNAIRLGLDVVLIDFDTIKAKDINEAILKGLIVPESLKKILRDNTYSGLEADLFLSRVDKPKSKKTNENKTPKAKKPKARFDF